MTIRIFLDLLQQTLWMVVMLGAPVLLTSLVVGLLISIFQAVTQIQEATLTFVPKILVSFIVLAVAGPWMVDVMVHHTARLFESLIQYAQH